MATKVGPLAADGGDPRLPDYAEANYQPPRMRPLHDHTVTIEEYEYYARKTRALEDEERERNPPQKGIKAVLFPSKNTVIEIEAKEKLEDDLPGTNISSRENRASITDDEWNNASRALRTASAGACFYLITTDVLGPFGIGFSIGLLGWGPGIALFTVFGGLAGYSGYLLWATFIALDSYEYPCKNYADLALRTYGRIPRHVVNLLQSIQLLFSVGIIVLSNGQAISQVSKFKLCYAVCTLIWALAGFLLGQVRTLQKFGWLANFAIFLNLMIMFITMGVFAHSPPNYEIQDFGSVGAALGLPQLFTKNPHTGKYPPIVHNGGMPASSNGFIGAINGLMQGVYAYAGLQLYVEFMAEMRRPRDFIKSLIGAQTFIYTVYMVYGSYCYFWQGQYTYQISYQGVSPYGWQVAGDMLAVLSGIIAAALYGNIGIKVLYNNLFMEFFSAPPLTTKGGKILWAVIVPVYWTIAFVVAASIPAFFGLTSLIAAVCFVQFTYTFPPMIAVAYRMQSEAIRPEQGEGFDPATGMVTRHDSGIPRLIRGFFGKHWWSPLINTWMIIYVLGALVVSGLGSYSAIKGLIAAFKTPQINSFTCTSPLNPNP